MLTLPRLSVRTVATGFIMMQVQRFRRCNVSDKKIKINERSNLTKLLIELTNVLLLGYVVGLYPLRSSGVDLCAPVPCAIVPIDYSSSSTSTSFGTAIYLCLGLGVMVVVYLFH